MFDRSKTQRIITIFILTAVSASVFYLFLAARYQSSISFLRTSTEANWILYQISPDTARRDNVFTNTTTDFVKDFNLPSTPQKAELHIRAFKKYHLWINNTESSQNQTAQTNWKKMDTLDISRLLVKGRNTIKIQVTCDYGPPALWLYISGLPEDIKTDTTWKTSISGSPYFAAGLANDCLVYPAGSEGPHPLRSFVIKLPILVLFFCIFCAAFYIHTHTRKNTKSAKSTAGRFSTFTPKFVLTVSTAIWAVVFIHNASQIPLNMGFDVNGHLEYIQYILEHRTVPLANEGWQAYQPPLFYALSALLVSIAKLLSSSETAYMILKLIPFLCGVGQIFLAYFASKTLFPNSTNKQALCVTFAALIPMNIYISHYVSNESACAFLTGLLILVTIIMLKKGSSTKLFCVLGIITGLALLTKFTAFVVLPVAALILLYKLISEEKQSLPKIIGYFGLTAIIIVGLAGWFYYRNWINFGKIFVGNWDPITGKSWWQDPGFHTYKYFCRFGEVFSIPYFSGFYSFFDSIYATFWGDSMIGGGTEYNYGPRWNYEYVSAVYILSLPAIIVLLTGAARAVKAAIFRNDKGWLLILGVLFIALWSTVYMSMRIPSYAQTKAFYSLFAVMPVALIFALGFSGLDEWLQNKGLLAVRTILYGWFGTLALAILFSFFINSANQRPHLSTFTKEGRLNEGVMYYTKLISGNPNSRHAHVELGVLYTLQGRYDDAIEQCKKAQQIRPDWPETLNLLSTLLANKPNGTAIERKDAVRYAERCCQLTGYLWEDSLFTLAQAYMAEGKASLAVKTAERAVERAKARGLTESAEAIQKWLQSVKSTQTELQKQP